MTKPRQKNRVASPAAAAPAKRPRTTPVPPSIDPTPPPDPGASPPTGFTETVTRSTSRFRISADNDQDPWWMGFEEPDADGRWRAVQAPGLRLELNDLEGFRDLLLRVCSKRGLCAPKLSLPELAEAYAFDARAGDPGALMIVKVLQALDVAVSDDDPTAADALLRAAHTTLLRRRPQNVPLGAGDPRIRRSGRTPAAAEALLECATEVIRRLPPPLVDRYQLKGTEVVVDDVYLEQADQLSWLIEELYPAIFPKSLAERRSAALALAKALRFTKRDPEPIAKAALMAFGFSEADAGNTFSYLDKRAATVKEA